MLRLIFLLSVCYSLSAGTGYSYIFSGLISLLFLMHLNVKISVFIVFLTLILFGFSLMSLDGVFILYGFFGMIFLRFRTPPYLFMFNVLLFITIISLISGVTNQSGLLQGIYFKPNNLAVSVSAGSVLLIRLLNKENTSSYRLYIYGIVFIVAAVLSGSRIAILVTALPYLRLLKERPYYFLIFLFALIAAYDQGLFDVLFEKLLRREDLMADERLVIWAEVINRLEFIKYADLIGIEKGLHNTFLFLLTNLGGFLGSLFSVLILIKFYKLSRLFGFMLILVLLIYLNVEVIAYKELWIISVFLIAELNYKESRKALLQRQLSIK